MFLKQQKDCSVKELHWTNCADEMCEPKKLEVFRNVQGSIYKHSYQHGYNIAQWNASFFGQLWQLLLLSCLDQSGDNCIQCFRDDFKTVGIILTHNAGSHEGENWHHIM